MSDAKQCDHCGKFFQKAIGEPSKLSYISRRGHDFYGELCPTCDQEIVKWLNKYKNLIDNEGRAR